MNEKTITNAVKSLGPRRIGGYLCAFGTPNDADLDGEYFTKNTNFELSWYTERPCLFGHGMDKSHKTTAIGTIDKLEIRDDAGLWAEAQLREQFMYEQYVMSWLEEGKLGWSSGSSPYYAKVDDDGFIRTWPIHEGSLTLRPAQPSKTTVRSIKHPIDIDVLHKAVKELGLNDYNIEDIMLHYETDVVNEEPKGEVITIKEGETRPIEIRNSFYITPNLQENKDIKMESNNTEINEEVVEEVEEEKETTVTTTITDEVAVTTSSGYIEVPTEPEPVKEVSDQYLINMARERMAIFEIPASETNLKDSVIKVKAWIQAKTFRPTVTLEEMEYARTDAQFQKFYNELIKSYTPSETKVEPVANPEVESLKQQVAQMQQMLGQGGKSMVPAADSSKDASAGSKYDSFYFIENASEKANYANFGFEDLAMYGYLRDQATRKGFAERPWRVNEQDNFYDALFHAGKDIVPEISHLIPNPHWYDNDNTSEEIMAVKAFRHMAREFRGKAIKADEVVSTGLSGRGQEWIYTLPDGTLWNMLLSETGVMSSIPSFNMTAGSVDMYIDDETGYASPVPEITDAGVSATARDDAGNLLGNYAITPAGSQKVNFSARHIGQQTIISKIELEDGRIDVARTARKHLEHALRRSIDWTIINAHNAGTNTQNYGHYGQSAQSSNTGKRGLAALGFDGLIARALTHTPAAGFQAGGDLCVDFLTSARRLMNQRYYTNHNMIRIIMTPEQCDLLWSLEEFKRAAQYSGSWDGGSGNNFTMFQGTPIIKSEEIEARNSSGQRHSTASNNTRGVVVFFRPDRCKLGIRRRLSRSMTEVGPYGESLRIGASLRFDFQTIPNAKNPSDSGVTGGSGLTRKPVSAIYDLN